MSRSDKTITMTEQLYSRLVGEVRRRHPRKSFGYLISDVDALTPTDVLFFEDNIRNSSQWRDTFESYGDYYIVHSDAGFVASPEEAWRLQKEIWARGMVEIGVFHSHHRHPADFSKIDFDMHVQRFDDLWHLLVSVRNPEQPVVRAFSVSAGGACELPIRIGERHAEPRTIGPRGRDEVIAYAGTVLATDATGRPLCPDATTVWNAVVDVLALDDQDLSHELLGRGLLRDAAERFERYVAADMCPLPPSVFTMGTDPSHTLDASPRHRVELSAFEIGRHPVTNELYSLLRPEWADTPARDRRAPVTGVSWTEAALFALWMGARLPTEAEFEYACAGGSTGAWCCPSDRELARFAWYCENSGGTVHPVGTREPNGFGISDMHGNVWEWCHDNYDSGFYAAAPRVDPVCSSPTAAGARVTRGGGLHARADMCRTTHRSHEAADFRAEDLGFRLARSSAPPGKG